VLIGPSSLGDTARLQNFLVRNGQPYHVLDPATDKDAADLVARYSPSRADLPLVVCPDGTVLRNPSETSLALAVGMITNQAHEKLYDVAVVGSGPAGLATAVYAASEGLSVAVFDARAFGGQAGASARIENYLGFPTGISGQALTGRAYTQAQKFGADMLIPVCVRSLDCSQRDGAFALATECGQSLRANRSWWRAGRVTGGPRSRISRNSKAAASGIGPRRSRPSCAWARTSYWSGGGNSAGQARCFCPAMPQGLHVIRGGGLGASMSRYLIERIEATPNIELMFNAEVSGSNGGGSLARVRWPAGWRPKQHASMSETCFDSLAPTRNHWSDRPAALTLDRAGMW
jgi:thioredoxin reductase (NADPH)